MNGNSEDVVYKYYQAYCDSDRESIEEVVGDEFYFTSPTDNKIDRVSYFKHCWPNNRTISDFKFIRVLPDGDSVVVTYEGVSLKGNKFRNTEVLTLKNNKVVEVEVYFGWSIPHEVEKGKTKMNHSK